MQEAWDLLHKKDWKLEKACGSDSVYTMTVPKIGKVFKLIVTTSDVAESRAD
jgi:hypothetical protein